MEPIVFSTLMAHETAKVANPEAASFATQMGRIAIPAAIGGAFSAISKPFATRAAAKANLLAQKEITKRTLIGAGATLGGAGMISGAILHNNPNQPKIAAWTGTHSALAALGLIGGAGYAAGIGGLGYLYGKDRGEKDVAGNTVGVGTPGLGTASLSQFAFPVPVLGSYLGYGPARYGYRRAVEKGLADQEEAAKV